MSFIMPISIKLLSKSSVHSNQLLIRYPNQLFKLTTDNIYLFVYHDILLS